CSCLRPRGRTHWAGYTSLGSSQVLPALCPRVKWRRLVGGAARSVGRRTGGRLAEALDKGRKALAFNMLHVVVMDAAVTAHRIDGNYIGMVQRSGRTGFIIEALELARVESGSKRQHLQGDPAAQRQLEGFIDRAHAAAADLLEQSKIPQQARVS